MPQISAESALEKQSFSEGIDVFAYTISNRNTSTRREIFASSSKQGGLLNNNNNNNNTVIDLVEYKFTQ
jgi:hypothetical protein